MNEVPGEENKECAVTTKKFVETVSVARARDIEALLDTGACISMVRRASLPEALLARMEAWKRAPLCGAGNKAIYPLGTVALTIRREGKAVDLPEVAVVDACPYPMLLGNDYLEKFGGFINCRTGELVAEIPKGEVTGGDAVGMAVDGDEVETIAGEREEMHAVGGNVCCATDGRDGHLHCTEQKWRVWPVETCVVPARSTVFVDMELGIKEGKEVIIESKLHCHSGNEWVVPKAVVQVENGIVRVPVTNLSERKVKLKRTDTRLKAFEIDEPHRWIGECDEEVGGIVGVLSQATHHDHAIAEAQVGDNLSANEADEVRGLLSKFSHCFRRDALPVAEWDGHPYEHRIDTGNQQPVSVCPRQKSPAERQAINEEVAEMLELGVIEPANGPWSSPVVLVKKKDGSVRFCVDYRRLNDVTVKDVYPLPRIDDVLDRLGGAKFFTTLDLYKGYWQVPMAEADRSKTAFVTPDGLFQFKRMSFGLCNAPASFQRMMDTILGPLKWKICLVYMDDILIYSESFTEHLERLALVLQAVQRAGLLLQIRKCLFASDRTKYLGHVISGEGIAPDPAKVESIVKFPAPRNLKELRRFLGMASFYRKFVDGFARVAGPLTQLLKKDSPWVWREKEEEAFKALLARLSGSPVLAHLDESAELVLRTDASVAGLGAVLSQRSGKDERVVAYLSKTLSEAEARWVTNDLECYAIVWAVDRWRAYLYGKKVTVKTDNQVARSLTTKKELKGKHARWVEKLSEFPGLTYEHCSGASNVVADALSRAPVSPAISSLSPEGSTSTPLFPTNHTPTNPQDSGVVAFVAASLSPPVPRKLTSVELGLRQRRDVRLVRLIDAAERGVVKRGEPPDSAGFRLFDGVLFKRSAGRGRRWRLVIPGTLRLDIMRACHDDATSGHEGQDKTFDRIASRFWWPGLRRYVRDYVSCCIFCLMRKTPRALPSGPMEFGPAPVSPFRSWGIDHLGPFPVTTGGNKYALVVVDYFSKWVVAGPLPDAKAKTAARFFLNEVVFKFGVPQQVVSDPGTSFTSHVWRDLMASLGIAHFYAAAEHQQTNGLTEKNNGTIVDRITAHIVDDVSLWDRQLSAAVFALNPRVQTSTGRTPFEINFGLDPVLPIDALVPVPPEPNAYANRVEELQATRGEVAERIRLAQQRQKLYYDRRRGPTQVFDPGDLVSSGGRPLSGGSRVNCSHATWGPLKSSASCRPPHTRLETCPKIGLVGGSTSSRLIRAS